MRAEYRRAEYQSGLTLIELMVAITIVGILAATAIPASSTFINRAKLLAAELTLTSKLKDFMVDLDYAPDTGMLADLVTEGYLDEIPNDPWTGLTPGPATGANEVGDWYYENNGEELILFALSHPGRVYKLPSYGTSPLQSVATPITPTAPTTPAPSTAAPPSPPTAAPRASAQAKAQAVAQAKAAQKQADAAQKQADKLSKQAQQAQQTASRPNATQKQKDRAAQLTAQAAQAQATADALAQAAADAAAAAAQL